MPTKQTNSKQPTQRLASESLAQAAPPETEDQDYALVSVLYHALQGVQASEQYINDAERAGDDELVKFFVESRDEQANRANRAKGLLTARIEDEDDEEQEDDGDEDEDDGDEDDAETEGQTE